MDKLSHVDNGGKATMVDVSDKLPQKRIARARGRIDLDAETIRLIKDNNLKKGDVLGVARLAGVLAAKQTQNLIPLCHTLILDKVGVELELDDKGVVAHSRVICVGRTGVEMEALTAVSVALLTVYDMCKAVDKNMVIGSIELIEKVKYDLKRH